MLENRSVRSKILASVGVVAIVAISVGVLAISRLGTVYHAAQVLVTDVVVPSDQLAKVEVDVQKSRALLRDAALAESPAATDAVITQIQALDATLTEDLAVYSPKASDPAAVEEFSTEWTAWKEIRDSKLIPAARANNIPEFIKINTSDATPVSTKASAALDKATKAQAAQAKSAWQVQSTYSSARTLVVIILVVGLALAIGSAELVTRRIVGPLRRVSEVVEGPGRR